MTALTLQAVLAIGRKYWGHIGTGLAVLFLLALGRGCATQTRLQAELAACLSQPPVTVKAETAAQAVASTRTIVKIVYKDKDIPCPDVELESYADSRGGSTATATAEKGLKMAPDAISRGMVSFSLGAGVYRGGVYPSIGAGLWTETRLGSLGLEVDSLWPMAWEASGETRRPAFVGRVTIRP